MRRTLLVSAIVVLAAATSFLVGGTALGKADAAAKTFKGKWDVTLATPFGDIPVMVSITPNGKGKAWLGTGQDVVNLVHQEWLTETTNGISWTMELPAVQSPNDQGHTIIGRGIIGEDGTLSGNLVIVTLNTDVESPVGYETHVGTFAATKRGK
jgi:hypothetical protein